MAVHPLSRRGARRRSARKLAELAEQREGPLQRRPAANRSATRFSRAPLVIGVVSCPKENPKIPQWEMLLSGGAAAMNLVIAANAMGYGTNWITNWYSDVPEGRAILGLAPHERVVGFVHIGTFKAGPGAPAARHRRRSMPTIPVPWKDEPMFYEPSKGQACRTIPSRRSSRRGRSAGFRRSVQTARSISRPTPTSMPCRAAAAGLVFVRGREGQREPRRETGEFVANLVEPASGREDERDVRQRAARRERIRPCRPDAGAVRLVKPPRVAEAPAALECKVTDIYRPAGSTARQTAPSWSSARWSACTSTRPI